MRHLGSTRKGVKIAIAPCLERWPYVGGGEEQRATSFSVKRTCSRFESEVCVLGRGNLGIIFGLFEMGIFFRLKKIFGERLSGRLMESKRVQARILCQALNMMTHLGMPESYRVR